MQITYPRVARNWPSPQIPNSWTHGTQLLEGKAFVELPLGVVSLTGEDRLSWFNSLVTQDFSDASPGAGAEGLVLDPQGRIELAFFAVDDGETLWVLTEEPGPAADFLEALRFRAKVKIHDESENFQVLGYLLPGGEVREAGGFWRNHAKLTWLDPWPGPVGDTTVFTPEGTSHPAAEPTAPQRELAVVSRPDLLTLESQAEAAGVVAAELGAWEAVRISLWRPRLGREGKPGTLPHETDWLRSAVHLHKGCYPGQETVAKLTNRGRPPRRLTFFDLDGSQEELPAIGSPLTLERDGSEVGVLTSVAYHPTDGQIGLGLLKRRVLPTETLVVEGRRVAQTVIVDPSGDNPRRMDEGKPGGLLGLKARKG